MKNKFENLFDPWVVFLLYILKNDKFQNWFQIWMTTWWLHVSIHLRCHIGMTLDLFGCPLRPEQRLRAETIQFESTKIGNDIPWQVQGQKWCTLWVWEPVWHTLTKFKDQNDALCEYKDQHHTSTQVWGPLMYFTLS